MKKITKLDNLLMSISLLICTIVVIMAKYKIKIYPEWMEDTVCIMVSFAFSWVFVFLFIRNTVLCFWNKVNAKYYLGGKWYVVYHEDRDFPSYIRSGTVMLKQWMDEVKMYNLLMRTPMIENNAIIGFDDRPTRDNEQRNRISTGSGEYVIDFDNLIFKGFFNLFRSDSNKNIMGIDIFTIHIAESAGKSPQHLSGSFYNAEKVRDKPISGIIVLYRNKVDAENYVRCRLKSTVTP